MSKLIPWIVLAVAVLAMSSGGLWFAALKVPGILRACWRLTSTSLLQIPGFIYDYRKADEDLRKRWKAQLPLLCLSGVSLAVHFGSWSLSVAWTSLTHSLLLVSTTPLFIVGVAALRHAASRIAFPKRYESLGEDGSSHSPESPRLASLPAPQPSSSSSSSSSRSGWSLAALLAPERSLPPTTLEAIGTLFGFVGTAALIVSAETDSGSEASVSLAGDVAALIGAVSFWLYILIGGRMRAWMPLWMYALPVTGSSAVVAGLASLLLETGVTAYGVDSLSLFGWLGDGPRFGLVLGAAAGSGILGHTGMNYSVAHLSPLVISVCGLWEPVIGSVLGWALGFQAVPGSMTLLSAPLLLLGALFTSVGGRGPDGQPQVTLGDLLRCKLSAKGSSSGNSSVNSADAQAGGVSVASSEAEEVR
jgi:drug/metabolite transporter (DMT)-like permease